MKETRDKRKTANIGDQRGFFAGIFHDLARDTLRFLVRSLVGFSLGTGAGAIACWYYGAPLIFSLAGGVLVLALVLFLSVGHVLS